MKAIKIMKQSVIVTAVVLVMAALGSPAQATTIQFDNVLLGIGNPNGLSSIVSADGALTFTASAGTFGYDSTDPVEGIGLGVNNTRIENGEWVTITVNPGWAVTLNSLIVEGVSNTTNGVERFSVALNGGAPVTYSGITGSGDDPVTVTFDPSALTSSLVVAGLNTTTGGSSNVTLNTLNYTATAAVPEPSTMLLLGSGLLGLAGYGRKKLFKM